jgi:hypothetical protein
MNEERDCLGNEKRKKKRIGGREKNLRNSKRRNNKTSWKLKKEQR